MKKQQFRGKVIQIFQQKPNIINLALETVIDQQKMILKFSGFTLHVYEYEIHEEVIVEGLWAWHKMYGRVIKGTIQPKHVRPLQRHRSNNKTKFNEKKIIEDLQELGIKTTKNIASVN
ncbi:hypothetical protein OAO18_03920 [Francisellaceae bacterium]|nr:hypothetical protein [Francisellaceae bacterium]